MFDAYPDDRRGACHECPFRRSNINDPDYAVEGLIIEPERVAEVLAAMREGTNFGCHHDAMNNDDDSTIACYGQMAMIAAWSAQDPVVAAANAYRAHRCQATHASRDLVTDPVEWQRLMHTAWEDIPSELL